MTSTILAPLDFKSKVTFGEPKLRTDGDVLVVAFGKHGLLHSMEEKGVLRRWKPDSGSQSEWFALSDMETLWAFSADARVIASASDDLSIWDASSGSLLTTISQPCWVTALAFHADPSFIATGHDDGSVNYWDAPGHHRVFEKPLTFHKKPISALAISPNGKWLAVASEDKQISVWNLATGAYHGCLVGHTDRIPAIAWHPSSNFLVSVGWDTTARVWDANSLQPAIILNTHASQVHAAAFSHDGRWLACADSSSTIHVWDFDKKATTYKLKVPNTEIRTLAFSRDGKYLACNGERMIHLWNPETGTPYADVSARPVGGTAVAVHPNGQYFVTNGGGTAARIWDTKSRKVFASLDAPQPIQAVGVSRDGKWIAGSHGNRIRIWDTNGKFVRDWEEADENISTIAFSPDSSLLASGSNHGDAVWVWRVADGEPILLIPDALVGCTIESLAFLSDNINLAVGGIDWMATGGSNGAVSIWNIHEKAETFTFLDGTPALAVHPSGKALAAATLDHAICIWDLQTKDLIRELNGHDGAIHCLAYSHDGAFLASGSDDQTLRVWDERGRERMVAEVESQVTSVAFSADGRTLFAGHANTTCSELQLPDSLTRK